MTGLFDFLSLGQGQSDQNAAYSPGLLALMGASQKLSDALAPQPASRLPLGKPGIGYLLGQAAGGAGQGLAASQILRQGQTKMYGEQLANMQAAQMYNLKAAALGWPTIPVPGMPGVGGKPSGAPPQAAGAQAAASAMVPPSAGLAPPVASAAPVAGLGAGAPSPAAGGGQPPVGGAFPPGFLQQLLTRQAFGINPTAEQQQLQAAGKNPYDLTDPAVRNVLNAATAHAVGIAPAVAPTRPGMLPQYWDANSGKYNFDTSAIPALSQGQFAAAAATGAGGLGAKEAEASFNAGLKVKTENTIERNKYFYQTGQRAPDAMANDPAMTPQAAPNGDVSMPDGTVIPSPPKTAPFLGADAMAKQNTNTQETEKAFGAIRGTLDGTESRMIGLAKALQTVQSGGLNERRAEIANIIAGAGMPGLAAKIMSAKDVSAVQTAMGLQTLDVLGQLKQINQGTGGRILNSEFTSLIDKQYGPDLAPQANFNLITQALGGIYQTKKMIDGYDKVAKPGGWRDANAYQSAFYSNPANSYQTMVDRAGQTIGPLKGMAAPPVAAIKHLQMNPTLRSEFDAKYGAGAATQYLGGK